MEEYDFSKTDYEACLKYPNLKWVYSRPNLLDAQHIAWSPFASETFSKAITPFTANEVTLKFDDAEQSLIDENEVSPGVMFVNMEFCDVTKTECIIQRGEIKWVSHFDDDYTLIEEMCGNVDIRISAFVTLYFKKFTGIVSFETVESQIYTVRLHPTYELIPSYPEKATKLLKKIYKK